MCAASVSYTHLDVYKRQEQWYIQCKRAAIPRKVLATIVEHMGMIPDTEPVSIVKDGEPQLIMPDVAADEIAHWRTGERTDAVTMATVIMQGYQIFQPDGGGACYGVSLLDLGIMEREMVEHGAAAVIDGDRLLWRGDTEVVAMDAVRKARSSWAKEWERAVWNALELSLIHISAPAKPWATITILKTKRFPHTP